MVSLSFKQGASLETIAAIVDAEGAKGVDLIVLPEAWRGNDIVEPLTGPTITTMSGLARKHRCYVVCPIYRGEQGRRLNTAVVMDRTGKVVSAYDKIYPYWNEFDMTPPALPGQADAGVYDADFGRIGFATCFDAKFPEVFQRLRDKGAELVVWPSAYSGFTELQAFALLHHYYIVTSTLTGDSILYNITGAIASDQRGTGGVTVARFTVDMDRMIYHYNFNLEQACTASGRALCRRRALDADMPREEWFVLRARRPGVSARALGREYGLEELRAYQDRSRTGVDAHRGFSFTGSVRRLPGPEGTAARGLQTMSRAAGVGLIATFLPALVLLGAVGQTPDDGIRLPTTDAHYGPVKDYVEAVPQADYKHAPPAAVEAFKDMKYGVRIHWGLYSRVLPEAQPWTFLPTCPMPTEANVSRDSYKKWNPQHFDAEEWMKFFERAAGLRSFAITTKHHEGFSLWDTKTRVHRRGRIGQTPVAPRSKTATWLTASWTRPFSATSSKSWCDAAHRHGIMIDLYFSHPDWYDADFRPYTFSPITTPGNTKQPELYGRTDVAQRTKFFFTAPDPTDEEQARMMSAPPPAAGGAADPLRADRHALSRHVARRTGVAAAARDDQARSQTAAQRDAPRARHRQLRRLLHAGGFRPRQPGEHGHALVRDLPSGPFVLLRARPGTAQGRPLDRPQPD